MEREWRYERKFAVENMSHKEAEISILTNKALFKEIYHGRQVNNIYFDNIFFSAYRSNIEGLSNRKKYRIRWYGDLFGEVIEPVLEAKIKNSVLGTKYKYKINNFKVTQKLDSKLLSKVLEKSDIPEDIFYEISALEPSLLNSYFRSYYISANKNYRITIDQQLKYYYIGPGINFILPKNSQKGIIIEIKYSVKDDDEVQMITNQFPFRLTRNSKYVQGLSLVNDLIY